MAGQLISVGTYTYEYNQGFYTSGGAGDVSGTSTILFLLSAPCTKVRLVYSNYIIGTTTGEAESIGTVTLQSSLQAVADTGTPVQFTWGGNNSVAIGPGNETATDWMTISGAAGQVVGARSFVTVNTASAFPIGPLSISNDTLAGFGTATAGDNFVQHSSGAGTNQILTPGATSAWSSSSGSYTYGPLRLEGYFSDGTIRTYLGIAGDSIASGQADNLGTGGFIVRGLYQLGVAFNKTTKPGESMSNFYPTPTYSQRLRRLVKNSAVIWQYGTNDINLPTTFTNLSNRTLSVWQKIAAEGATIFPTTLLPRPTYTGTMYPVTNQVVSIYLAVFQQYNAWLRAPASAGAGASARYDAAAVGITLGPLIDAASYIETNSSNATPGGPSAPFTNGFWYCGPGNNTAYSPDAIHPNYAGVQLLIPSVLANGPAIIAATPASGGVPSGTTYPASAPLATIASGNAYVTTPWTIPATGVPGSTGSVQTGSTSIIVNTSAPHAADELLDLVDRMISDKRANLY